MKISVIGLGKLGFPMATFLAKTKFKINCYDVNKNLVQLLKKKNNRYLPFEKGIKRNFKNIKYFNNIRKCLHDTSLCFITVPTPSKKNGEFKRDYILKVLENISIFLKKKKLKKPFIININSTINPGDIEYFNKYLEKKNLAQNKDFTFIYNPYFVALGEVYFNLSKPNFILVGYSDNFSKQTIKFIYKKIYNRPNFKFLSIKEAEITKILLNCYVTTKISFTNFINAMCDKIGVKDSSRVLKTLSSDKRVGKYYFSKGGPYSGPCFPRDNSSLSKFCKKIKVPASIPVATNFINEYTINNFLTKFNSLKNIKTFGVLGVSYKPRTDCVDDSISIKLMDRALSKKVKVYYYDKYTNLKNKKFHKKKFLKDILNICDVIFVGYKDREFERISSNKNIIFWDPFSFIKKRKNFKFI